MHQKSLPPRGKAIYFCLISWLPLGGKLSTKLTDEGQLQYRLNSFLQKTSCPSHHLASQGVSPEGEAYIFALFSWLPLGGKLSTKLTDEGQLQYRLNSFLQKTSCPPHHLASQGASPRGGSLYFCLIFPASPWGKPIFAAERIAACFLYLPTIFAKFLKTLCPPPIPCTNPGISKSLYSS